MRGSDFVQIPIVHVSLINVYCNGKNLLFFPFFPFQHVLSQASRTLADLKFLRQMAAMSVIVPTESSSHAPPTLVVRIVFRPTVFIG